MGMQQRREPDGEGRPDPAVQRQGERGDVGLVLGRVRQEGRGRGGEAFRAAKDIARTEVLVLQIEDAGVEDAARIAASRAARGWAARRSPLVSTVSAMASLPPRLGPA